jgi:hypothetical protein
MTAEAKFRVDIAFGSIGGVGGGSRGNTVKRYGGGLPQAWP